MAKTQATSEVEQTTPETVEATEAPFAEESAQAMAEDAKAVFLVHPATKGASVALRVDH